ncbi:MAG: bifunctional isocitrate dehydrogenase kinase/phosphatase [Anaerolineae bacterium]
MPSQGFTDSRLANIGANAICDAFEDYQIKFHAITRRAQGRFERCDWRGMVADAAERLDLYTSVLGQIVADVCALLDGRVNDKLVWVSLKAVYSGLIAERDDWELAETWFNSVTRRIFATVGVDPQIEFVDTDFGTPPTSTTYPIYRRYEIEGSVHALVESILCAYTFRVEYQDLERDTRRVASRLQAYLDSRADLPPFTGIEMVRPVFYRGRGAYLVGRLCLGEQHLPFVLALLNDESGVWVDAVLLEEDDISHVFGFTRSYFHVQVERPYDLTHFLKSILPRKRIAELYIAIGCNKHGKTELYRDLLHHLEQTDDKFDIAPGERGMVMVVFTMPSYDVVFKIIRDRFPEPKSTSRAEVMGKYRLVFKHDRAGRLIDAQEFEHLQFSCDRFTPRLIEELRRTAANSVDIGDRFVHIKHLYVERRITPLNVFMREMSPAECELVVADYGNCIKDLAAANIFPGDILLKNFGVTRHGRVVFYDYDELTLLTTCNFREMPRAADEDEEMYSEPWFSVGPNDFFPEEFRTWLGLAAPWREVFTRHHGDLFGIDFWRGTQDRIRAGEIIPIYPYSQSRRLVS